MTDARARVTGSLQFAGDQRVDGAAEAAGVRSPHARARITAIDPSAALACPGVIAVYTGESALRRGSAAGFRFGDRVVDQPILAEDVVNHMGELVALVVAESREQALEAAGLVDVDYEELPYVVDALEALESGAPQVHPEMAGNVCGRWDMALGDQDEGWALATRVFENDYYSPAASHVPMEPHSATAVWEDGRLTVYTGTQSPWLVSSVLAATFGLTPQDVRVVSGNLGGAFGAKCDAVIEPVAAFAARELGRPVAYQLTREEVFYSVGKHAAHVHMRTGVTDDGVLCARDVRVVWNAGAYATSSPDAAGSGMIRSLGPYRTPHARVTSIAAYTNTVPSGPFRGAMTSQLVWAYESQLDDIAVDLGLSPLEIRRRNVLRDGDAFVGPAPMHDMHYEEMLDDLDQAAALFTTDAPAPPECVRGVGFALMLKTTLTPSRTEVDVVLAPDGRAIVQSSAVEMGQGAVRALPQMAATALGITPRDVSLSRPDTAQTPYDTMSASSRTTFSSGVAIEDACGRIRTTLSEVGARHWNVDASEVGLEGEDLVLFSSGERAKWGPLVGGEPVRAHGTYKSEGGLTALTDPGAGVVTAHWHQGAMVVQVEVDTRSGKVTVLNVHAACYAGRVISPIDVQKQIEGCVIFGLGPALYEELLYDDGRVVNPNFSSYLIPTIRENPQRLTTQAVESGSAAEVHGVAEMNVPVVAPAIGNAIRAATGVRLERLPMQAEDLYWALHPRTEEAV